MVATGGEEVDAGIELEVEGIEESERMEEGDDETTWLDRLLVLSHSLCRMNTRTQQLYDASLALQPQLPLQSHHRSLMLLRPQPGSKISSAIVRISSSSYLPQSTISRRQVLRRYESLHYYNPLVFAAAN